MSQIEDLEAQFRAAQGALESYSTAVTEKYRAEMPGTGDDIVLARARAWTGEEKGELGRLRAAATDAALALHRARREAAGGA